MLEDCDDRRHEHFQYFKPLSGLNLEPIMNTFKHSSSKLQNVCMGATNVVLQSLNDKRRYVSGNFSKTVHNCLRNVLGRGSKTKPQPSINV